MKGSSELADGMREIIESVDKGDLLKMATDFFQKRIRPNGEKWGRDASPKLGFASAPRVTRENKKETRDGLVYRARVRFAPGGSGGAGVGVDTSGSNQLYNDMGGDRRAVNAITKAFHNEAIGAQRKLNETLRRWFTEPENFMHHIVGYGNKDKYTVVNCVLGEVKYENAVMDPTRRQWPADRVEVWVPITVDVVITVKKKLGEAI